MRLIQTALTFDDVLLVPAFSDVLPRDTSLKTRLTRNISLNMPLVSAAMDTVTEARLAIAMAQMGGVGIIHKNLTPAEQAREVAKVKRFESGVVRDPITVPPQMKVRDVIALSRQHGISGFPVVEGAQLIGIVTNRDLRFEERLDEPVRNIMTPRERLVTVKEGTPLAEAKALMHSHRLERVLVINDAFELRGLMTVKDITKQTEHPDACKDEHGKLRAGAAVGVGEDNEERVELLVQAGVDVIVVDTAHGHSKGVLERVKWVKQNFPHVEVIGGNIATAAAAKGARRIRCRRREGRYRPGLDLHDADRRGVGVPQVTAISNVSEALKGTGVPVIADGGVRFSGDVSKALAAGANSVMMGSMFAGTKKRRATCSCSGPPVQVVPWHGFGRRDEGRRGRPLLPGQLREHRQAGAGRYRRPRRLQGLGQRDPVPADRRRARQHGLLRLPHDRGDERQGRVRADHGRGLARVARA
jgi:IMP dehydrogenase/GMP reductase